MSNILCFGDSITQGYTDPAGGWTQRLRQKLDATYFHIYKNGITVPAHDVFNLGISGDTSAGLLARIASEIKPRLLNEDSIIIIAIGTNDSVYRQTDDSVETTEEQYGDNLLKLIQIAKQTTDKVIIVGTLPCDESKMQPMPWSSSGKSYSNQRLKEFNDTAMNVASEQNVQIVNMFEKLNIENPDSYLHDGIHPNENGHQLISDSIFSVIEPILAPV
jgi:lysophospholipase L1-like esterase